MTPGEPFPFLPDPAAWAARFPRRRHLWAGPVRVWRVEAPGAIPDAQQARVAGWVARAAALGRPDPPAESTWMEATATTSARRTATYLDLPGGPYPAALAGPLPAWSGFTPADVPAVFKATVAGPKDVPIIRAERLTAVAIDEGDEVAVYADGPPIARVPREALVVPGDDEWARAWRAYAAATGLPPEWVNCGVEYTQGVVHLKRPAGDVSETLKGAWLWIGDGLRAGAEVRAG